MYVYPDTIGTTRCRSKTCESNHTKAGQLSDMAIHRLKGIWRAWPGLLRYSTVHWLLPCKSLAVQGRLATVGDGVTDSQGPVKPGTTLKSPLTGTLFHNVTGSYELYPFYRGSLTVKAVNQQPAQSSHRHNRYRPHSGMDLEAPPMDCYQPLIQAA